MNTDAVTRVSATTDSWDVATVALTDLPQVGVDQCPGPGSRHTPPPVASGLTREACRGLGEMGARRLGFMTFHGSPLHSVALDRAGRPGTTHAPLDAVMPAPWTRVAWQG